MTKIELLEADIIRDEGEVLHAYQDSLGYWTIGVGVLIDKRKGGGITREESRYLLQNRLKIALDDLLTFPWFMGLDSVRKRATASLRYQLGPEGFRAFNKGPTSTLAALAAGDYDTAASRLLKNKIARQTPERMARIAQMWRTGEAA